jgi:hypothetical protein
MREFRERMAESFAGSTTGWGDDGLVPMTA